MRQLGMLALLAALAAAENDPAAQVKRLAEEGKGAEAVRLAGTWAANAQKRGDLLDEEAAWKALRGVPFDYREACAELMKLLEPGRNGAYLSANLLALEVLKAAIREGDDLHLGDAASILAAPRRDAGALAAVLEDLAAGVVAARKDQAAEARLKKAFEAALKNGWLEVAIYAGTELACVERKLGRESDAFARLDTALREGNDRWLLQLRRALAEKRIPERPFELGPGGVSTKGGKGGRGDVTESAVGAAWKTHAEAKPLLTVKRGAKGFEIEPRFKGAAKEERALDTGVRHWNGGGITLTFCGPGVSLTMVDLTGRLGQPGESSQPQPWQFFYLLAPGETWSVTKEGVVAVKK